jgi:hypothetical protein
VVEKKEDRRVGESRFSAVWLVLMVRQAHHEDQTKILTLSLSKGEGTGIPSNNYLASEGILK